MIALEFDASLLTLLLLLFFGQGGREGEQSCSNPFYFSFLTGLCWCTWLNRCFKKLRGKPVWISSNRSILPLATIKGQTKRLLQSQHSYFFLITLSRRDLKREDPSWKLERDDTLVRWDFKALVFRQPPPASQERVEMPSSIREFPCLGRDFLAGQCSSPSPGYMQSSWLQQSVILLGPAYNRWPN